MYGPARVSKDLLALCLLLCATLGGLMWSYAQPRGFDVGVSGEHDKLHLQTFHDPEALAGQTAPSYRWTEERSVIHAPGLGRGVWRTDLTLSSPQPVGKPKQVLIEAGEQSWPLQLRPEPRVYHLLTPSDGDLRLTIAAPVQQYGKDPRPLGIAFLGAGFQPVVAAAFPPILLLLHALVALALAFLTLRLIGLPIGPALLVSFVGLLLLIYGILTNRGSLGLYSIRILALALVGLMLVAATRWSVPRLFQLGHVEISPEALSALLLIVYGSYLLKAGGLLWPYFTAIDIEWHMEKTRRVLGGRIGELWRADSPFHQSVMPELWGQNKPVIPYSPFYHIFSALWAIFPWQLETSANVFSTILDALRPTMIFFIVRKFGFRERAGLFAALCYSVIPATFLLHAWGNTPTTNGMWWSLLSITLLVGTWGRLRSNRWAWLALTLVLTATMLFYAVTAVFTTLLALGIITGLVVSEQKREALPLFLSLATAVLLSIGIYYWQFVPLIIARTIPKFAGAIEQGGKELGLAPITWPQFLWKYVYLLDIYGMYLPLGFGIAGWWIGVRKLGARSPFAFLMTSWLIVAIVFWFVGFRVDMVDKQLFWLMPWMGIGAGIAVDRLLDQRRALRWALPLLILGTLYLGSDAVYLWIHRLHGYRGDLAYTSWFQVLRNLL